MTELFISGPISGVPDYGMNFGRASKELVDAGYEIMTPVNNRPWVVDEDEALWTSYMRASLRQLLRCHGVALLEGWQYSRGAQVEKALADSLGIPVKTVSEWVWGDVWNARD